MQIVGHIEIKGEIIKVLVRPNIKKYYTSIKVRSNGKDGRLFSDESEFLESRPDLVSRLKAGEVIKI